MSSSTPDSCFNREVSTSTTRFYEVKGKSKIDAIPTAITQPNGKAITLEKFAEKLPVGKFKV
jgi:hypothetical protein